MLSLEVQRTNYITIDSTGYRYSAGTNYTCMRKGIVITIPKHILKGIYTQSLIMSVLWALKGCRGHRFLFQNYFHDVMWGFVVFM